MPCVKKPQRASLGELCFERDGEYAVITFADAVVRDESEARSEVQRMPDLELLEGSNEVVIGGERRFLDQTVIEIPVGTPQIEYAGSSHKWIPIGDVLRCIIDGSDDGQPTI